MGMIIKPNTGKATKPALDPNILGQVNALMKWAQITDDRNALFQEAHIRAESTFLQMMASLEALCKILIEKDIVDRAEYDAHRQDYFDKVEQRRKAAEEEMDKAGPQIWVPDKKIVPAR
jgi:hypothetical protein